VGFCTWVQGEQKVAVGRKEKRDFEPNGKNLDVSARKNWRTRCPVGGFPQLQEL